VERDVIVHEVTLPKQIESKEVQNVPLISFGSSDSENADDVPRLLPTEVSEHEGASKLSDSSSNGESNGVGRQEEQSKSQTAPGWRSSRVHKVPDKLCASVNAELESVLVPKSYEEAMASIHSVQWLEAMKDELKSHEEHETWVLEVKPENLKTVKSKWVFAVKTDEFNKPKFKARLVALGYSQRLNIDYMETYALVASNETLLACLGVIAADNLEVVQIDVRTVFLNSELNENIYIYIYIWSLHMVS
jgi:hypothetical protein